MALLHSIHARARHLVPLWVAVASGLAGVLFVISAAAVFTLLGGPVTISIGEPDPLAAPFIPAGQTTTVPRPTALPVASTPAAPTSVPSPAAATPTPSRVTADQPPTFLKNLATPTGSTFQVRPQTITGQRYEEAFKLDCRGANYSPYRTSWTVSGFSRFTAVIGIADDEESALNVVGRVSIQNEDGANLIAPFEVSLGQPQTVDIAIAGIVQLQVFSSCRNARTGRGDGSYVTLANAALR